MLRWRINRDIISACGSFGVHGRILAKCFLFFCRDAVIETVLKQWSVKQSCRTCAGGDDDTALLSAFYCLLNRQSSRIAEILNSPRSQIHLQKPQKSCILIKSDYDLTNTIHLGAGAQARVQLWQKLETTARLWTTAGANKGTKGFSLLTG